MILCDDDLIEWDDDYPPQLGQEEDKAQSIKRYYSIGFEFPVKKNVLF